MSTQHTAPEQTRVEQLEALVSRLRHDLRGAITPAALVADQLRGHSEAPVQRAGKRIGEMVQRVLNTLEETYQYVPPREARSSSPLLGARPDEPSRTHGAR